MVPKIKNILNAMKFATQKKPDMLIINMIFGITGIDSKLKI